MGHTVIDTNESGFKEDERTHARQQPKEHDRNALRSSAPNNVRRDFAAPLYRIAISRKIAHHASLIAKSRLKAPS
jgi:hypothetical protein